MSEAIWNLGYDGQNEPYTVLFSALFTGVILGGSSSSFTMKDGPNVVIFQGSFGLTNGVITAGTISGFQVYFNSPADKLIDVSGYSIDFIVFKNSLTALNGNDPIPLNHLLFDNPMTVDGADQPMTREESIAGGVSGDHLFGHGGKDNIVDAGGSDVIDGGVGDDVIIDDELGVGAVPGDDIIFGRDGDDIISAGGGNDFLSGGQGKDLLDGGPDSDTADYSEKPDTVVVVLNGPNDTQVLIGGFVEDTFRNIENVNGGTVNDQITGDGLKNRLVGNSGDDKLVGKKGNDSLEGGDDNDRCNGGPGNDQVGGGLGKDSLKGGPDRDTFLFDTALGAGNVDKIKDLRGTDRIALDIDIFGALPLGGLKAKFFHSGAHATDGNDHVIYDEDAGRLFYDHDGKGGAHQVVFAKVFDHSSHHPTLQAGDLLVI